MAEIDWDWKNAPGYLKDEERELLYKLAGELGGKETVMVNIGVEFGASLACLRAGSLSTEVIAFDPDMSKVLHEGYGAQLFEMSSHSEEAFALVQELIKLPETKLQLVFVDGDHGKAGVLLDARFASLLEPGGYILFQDCWDWDKGIGVVHEVVPGVNVAVTEWFALPEIKASFEELGSVGTTRVFRKISYDGRNPTDDSGSDTDLQPERNSKEEYSSTPTETVVSGKSRNTGRRR